MVFRKFTLLPISGLCSCSASVELKRKILMHAFNKPSSLETKKTGFMRLLIGSKRYRGWIHREFPLYHTWSVVFKASATGTPSF